MQQGQQCSDSWMKRSHSPQNTLRHKGQAKTWKPAERRRNIPDVEEWLVQQSWSVANIMRANHSPVLVKLVHSGFPRNIIYVCFKLNWRVKALVQWLNVTERKLILKITNSKEMPVSLGTQHLTLLQTHSCFSVDKHMLQLFIQTKHSHLYNYFQEEIELDRCSSSLKI